MRLDDWLAHQQAQHPNAIELGLDRVRTVATRLGILPWRLPSVIVGGTNGKGSTVAYLTSLARHAGLRTGTYTSPHLQRYNERIAIDGTPILDDSLIELFERIEHRGVFGDDADEVLSFLGVLFGNAADGQVVAFGGTAGPHNFAGVGTNEVGHVFAGILNGSGGRAPRVISL